MLFIIMGAVFMGFGVLYILKPRVAWVVLVWWFLRDEATYLDFRPVLRFFGAVVLMIGAVLLGLGIAEL